MKNYTRLEFNLLVENQKDNSSVDFIRKKLASSNLKEVEEVTSFDVGIEVEKPVVGKIYSLDDCYLVIISTYEEVYSLYIDRADIAKMVVLNYVHKLSKKIFYEKK
jgi:hypothetical protein